MAHNTTLEKPSNLTIGSPIVLKDYPCSCFQKNARLTPHMLERLERDANSKKLVRRQANQTGRANKVVTIKQNRSSHWRTDWVEGLGDDNHSEFYYRPIETLLMYWK